MKQREVTGADNIKWTCVQAYSGSDGEVSERIEEKSETEDGKVPVVCTPSGGAQSIRLNLQKDWEQISDEQLLGFISKNS